MGPTEQKVLVEVVAEPAWQQVLVAIAVAGAAGVVGLLFRRKR